MARKLPPGMEKRGRVYYANFMAGGRRVRKRLCGDLREAGHLLTELRSRANRSDFGLLDNNVSIASLRDDWLQHCDQTLRPSTVQRYRENLANVLGSIPATRAAQVTIQRVLAYRRERLSAGLSARSVNMDVGALSTMFNWAVNNRIIASNPLEGIKRLPSDAKRKERRALTVEEVEAIFEHSPDYLKPVWRLFATTGIRRGELVGLRFDDIDFEGRTMTVQASTAKSHKARTIPLDDTALALLTELRDQAEHRQPLKRWAARFSREHVFVTKAGTPFQGDLLSRFYAICRKAGIEGAEPHGSVDIHALRVTFTTLSLEHGATPKAVQEILGHATLAMTMGVYAKATERGKREAIGALPFASVSGPDHLLSLTHPQQIDANLPQMSDRDDLPLKNKA